MYYTIACMEEIASGQKLEFCKNGNAYVVSLYDPESDRHVSKQYNNSNEAKFVFNKISDAFIEGMYSFENRKNMM